MGGLADATLLALVAVGSLRGAGSLLRARWPRRAPATAILLWQALGLTGGLAAVGALLAMAIGGTRVARSGVAGGLTAMVWESALARTDGVGRLLISGEPLLLTLARAASLLAGISLFAVLCWMLVMAFAGAVQARRRQRELLALLAHGDPKAPGALVIDYPAAAAYCLPGIKSQIVVSVGTLDLLAPAELAAVLAHERAHLRARHDLVLIPFTSLRRAFPRSRMISQAYRTVALLVEMMADDRALRIPARGRCAEERTLLARELATALLRFGTAPVSADAPAGAMAATEGDLTARVNRLLTPPQPLTRAARASILIGSAALVAVPIALLVVTP
jgi:Zn-dependent protease with chaperone function